MGKSYDVPMTVLGDKFGPISRDIADNKPNDKRAPFTLSPIDSTTLYYGLHNNDAKNQICLVIRPDKAAIPKSVVDNEKTQKHCKNGN